MAYNEKYANFDLATGSNDGSSEADAWQTIGDLIANVAAGDRVNIKRQATAFDLTGDATFSTSGTATTPIYYRAYETTPGDGGIWEVAYNTGTMASLIFSGNYNIVEGIHFKPGASVNLNYMQVTGIQSWAIRCKIQNNNSSGNIANAYKCWISINTTSTHGITTAGTNNYASIWKDCFIKRISGNGSQTLLVSNDNYGRMTVYDNCIFKGIGAASENGLFINRANDERGLVVNNCIFYDFYNGINIDEEPNAGMESAYIINNIFDTMSGRAILANNTPAGFLRAFNNFYKDCTSGFTNYGDEDTLIGNIPFTVDPFNDVSNDDFTLNDTANAGAIIRAAEESMDPTNSSFMKIRTLANFMPNIGSGGGLLTHPGMSGGIRG